MSSFQYILDNHIKIKNIISLSYQKVICFIFGGVVAWLDMENPIKNAPNLVPNEDISYEEALELAAGIAKLWNLKINAEIENNDNSGKSVRCL